MASAQAVTPARGLSPANTSEGIYPRCYSIQNYAYLVNAFWRLNKDFVFLSSSDEILLCEYNHTV